MSCPICRTDVCINVNARDKSLHVPSLATASKTCSFNSVCLPASRTTERLLKVNMVLNVHRNHTFTSLMVRLYHQWRQLFRSFPLHWRQHTRRAMRGKNQQTREIISARKTSRKHNNKDLSWHASKINSFKSILILSLRALYLLACQARFTVGLFVFVVCLWLLLNRFFVCLFLVVVWVCSFLLFVCGVVIESFLFVYSWLLFGFVCLVQRASLTG